MRVYQLAKELGVDSKELTAKLQKIGAEVKNHMSSVDETMMELVRAEYAPVKQEAETPTSAPAPAATPVEEPASPASTESVEEVSEPVPAEPAQAEPAGAEPLTEQPSDEKVIKVRGAVVVKELAELLGIRPNQLIAELMHMNVFATINQRVELNLIQKLAEEHGFGFEHEKRTAEQALTPQRIADDLETEPEDRDEDLLPRPPVVTFLGHVDHGKTSILDKIRNASVATGEHGGITQHIGAYTTEINGRQITFLDTPGHAAFTAMRARGANMTDIAVIIIAADDGVMPQTREAIAHAQAAEVSIMIAINKMDLPGANPDQVKQQLQELGLAPEDWGGDLICCEVSAETGDGIDHLLEMILLQSEILELKANPNRLAKGFVIEGSMEPGMGPVADLLVTSGTIKIGDPILCEGHWGRVKALINDHGVKLKSSGPAVPVRCMGLSGAPEAGSEFRSCKSDKWARNKAKGVQDESSLSNLAVSRKTSLESLFEQIQTEDQLELKVVIKGDTQGSVEAIIHSLNEIKSDKVSLGFVLTGTGNITVNDVMLASASNAIILGFHIAVESSVSSVAKREGVEIRLHHVIYELIDEVGAAMTGLLAPEIHEEIIGRSEVREVFDLGKKAGKVAGCLVTSGVVRSRARARVRRGDDILYEGAVTSLKHFQDNVKEVREAQECGIMLEKSAEFTEGDTLEFYELKEVKQTL